MFKLWATRLCPELADSAWAQCYPQLTEQRRKKVQACLRPQQKMRHIATEALLHYVLIREFGMAKSEIAFLHNEFGKPMLRSAWPHFNVSHSGEWVVAAFSSAPLGIDIEAVDERLSKLVPLVLTDREREKWTFAPMQAEYVCSRWVLKESFVKALGVGLQFPLTAVNPAWNGRDRWKFAYQGRTYHFKRITVDPAYRLAVCSLLSELPERVELIPVRDCIDLFAALGPVGRSV